MYLYFVLLTELQHYWFIESVLSTSWVLVSTKKFHANIWVNEGNNCVRHYFLKKKWHSRLTCVPCSMFMSSVTHPLHPLVEETSIIIKDVAIATVLSTLTSQIYSKVIRGIWVTRQDRYFSLEIIIAIINDLILYHVSHWKWKERQKNTSFPRRATLREQGRVLGTSWCISLPALISKPSHNCFYQCRFLLGLILSLFENQYLIPISK